MRREETRTKNTMLKQIFRIHHIRRYSLENATKTATEVLNNELAMLLQLGKPAAVLRRFQTDIMPAIATLPDKETFTLVMKSVSKLQNTEETDKSWDSLLRYDKLKIKIWDQMRQHGVEGHDDTSYLLAMIAPLERVANSQVTPGEALTYHKQAMKCYMSLRSRSRVPSLYSIRALIHASVKYSPHVEEMLRLYRDFLEFYSNEEFLNVPVIVQFFGRLADIKTSVPVLLSVMDDTVRLRKESIDELPLSKVAAYFLRRDREVGEAIVSHLISLGSFECLTLVPRLQEESTPDKLYKYAKDSVLKIQQRAGSTSGNAVVTVWKDLIKAYVKDTGLSHSVKYQYVSMAFRDMLESGGSVTYPLAATIMNLFSYLQRPKSVLFMYQNFRFRREFLKFDKEQVAQHDIPSSIEDVPVEDRWIITACIDRFDAQDALRDGSSDAILNVLIDSCGFNKQMELLDTLLRKLKENHFEISNNNYNSIIEAYLRNQQYTKAIAYFQELDRLAARSPRHAVSVKTVRTLYSGTADLNMRRKFYAILKPRFPHALP